MSKWNSAHLKVEFFFVCFFFCLVLMVGAFLVAIKMDNQSSCTT